MTAPSLTIPNSQREKGTPAALWRVNGEPDPFGSTYDGLGRHELAGGQHTDDELAHMCGMADGRSMQDTAVFTMAKERIRWLSRQLEAASARPSPADPVRAALEEQDPLTRPPFTLSCDSQRRALAATVGPDDEVLARVISDAQMLHDILTLEPSKTTYQPLVEATRRAVAALSVSTPTGEGEAPWNEELDLSDKARSLINSEPRLLSLLYDLDLLPEQLVSQDKKTPGLIKAYHRLYGVLYAFQALAHPQQGGERDGYTSRLEQTAWSQASIVSGYWLKSRPDYDVVSVVNRDLRLLHEATHEAIAVAAPTSPSESSGEEA